MSAPTPQTHYPLCLNHLQHRAHEWTETHGLDCGPYEHCREEWEECAVCGEQFSGEQEVGGLERDYQDGECPECGGYNGGAHQCACLDNADDAADRAYDASVEDGI